MIAVHTRKHRHLAVFGLGASGSAAAQALAASGAEVAAWDDDSDSRRRAKRAGIPLVDLYHCDWAAMDALVLSPGIALTRHAHRVVELARGGGCPIVGDIELLAEACPATRVIAVTGTNGKSTTAALIGHILTQAGRRVQVGGNLGPPALAFTPPGKDELLVLELSSYQLDLTENAAFAIAVLINLTPDHLDRHGSLKAYAGAKRRIFRDRAGGGQVAVVGVDDAHGRTLCDELAARGGWRVVPISSGRRLDDGVFAHDGKLFDATDGEAEEVCGLAAIATLPGVHNWQNAAAAFAACRAAGVDVRAIARGLAGFPGLPHRQEPVLTIGDVRYVNDSKATNAEAAAKALACYQRIYWIAGGRAKEGGLAPVFPHLDRIQRVYLIGAAQGAFAESLAGKVRVRRCGDLANAVREAHVEAQADDEPCCVVLLSPACASFDQWKNFAARGDAFRALVRELAEETAR